MTTRQIQHLVLSMPAESPYFELVFGAHPGKLPSLAERLQVALADPAFCWNMARSYAQAAMSLPGFEWPHSVHRAYVLLTHPEHTDENLAQARDLQTPEYRDERDVIRALLLCGDANDEVIAEIFGVEIEVVTLFHDLWWNVRERKNDLLYVAQLLNGALLPVDGQSDLGHRLMRLARLSGRYKAVLLASGRARSIENEQPDDALAEQIAQTVLTEAVLGQQMGLVGKANPALALVEKYLLAGSEPLEPDIRLTDPLTAISLNPRFRAVIEEHMRRPLSNHLRGEQALSVEEILKENNTNPNMKSDANKT